MSQLPASRPRRLLRGYGPLAVACVLFAGMSLAVPSVNEKVDTRVVDIDGGRVGVPPVTTASGGPVPSNTSATDPPVVASGRAPGRQMTAAPGATGACADRRQQVQGDPYSPPCVAFSGANGGSTSGGVTADAVVVSSRALPDVVSIFDELAQLGGGRFAETQDDIKRITLGLADYFNAHFQFYGRKLKIAFFDGKGSALAELAGGGQQEAEADALTAAAEIKAFAGLEAVSTVPYADALARRHVLSLGVPGPSREWMTARRPYVWSSFADCSSIVEGLADYTNKRLANRRARWAGAPLRDQVRKIAEVGPDGPWYNECAQELQDKVRAAGNELALPGRYRIELASTSNQASALVAKLKSQAITTVICDCDPFFLAFATAKAKEQGYQPEWITGGAGFADLDIAGQIFDKEQWSHAFGISNNGNAQPLRATLGYNAYKSVRGDEPGFAVELLYNEMYLLALGIQGAGPNLTPETFERGLFAYPGGTGPLGTWHFGPGQYSPQRDAREIWWDSGRRSVSNGQPGTWVESQPGARYRPGQWPVGEPGVFR